MVLFAIENHGKRESLFFKKRNSVVIRWNKRDSIWVNNNVC